MSIIKAKPPGQPIPRIDKRAIESILYSIDLTELLQQGELAIGVEPSQNTLDLTDFKIRLGKTIEVRVPPSTTNTSQYLDYTISILFKTSIDNIRSAVFQLRVHK